MNKAIDLHSISLFDGLTDMEIDHLLKCMLTFKKEFDKGEIAYLEQENIKYIGIILSGSVHMIKEDIWGHRTLLSYMEAGELFGESMAVQKVNLASVTFQCAEKSEIMFVPATNIIHTCPMQCHFHQKLAENMFNLLGEKSLRLMEKINIASKPTLREKILAYLSLLSQKQNKRTVESPLNRTALAEYLDANRSSMTRELTNMKEEGIIDYDRNTYRILI